MNLPEYEDFRGSGIEIQVGSEKNWEDRRFKSGWDEIKLKL